MSEPVFVVCLWLFVERRWSAFVRLPDGEKALAINSQLAASLPSFSCVIEVERDDVEVIEARLAQMEPVEPEFAFSMLFRVVELLSADPRSFADADAEPSGDAVH